jgi:hypothetical protein
MSRRYNGASRGLSSQNRRPARQFCVASGDKVVDELWIICELLVILSTEIFDFLAFYYCRSDHLLRSLLQVRESGGGKRVARISHL